MVESEIRLEKADLVILENRWQDACSERGLTGKRTFAQSSVFELVARAYFEREGYHNLDHLSFMFRLLDQYKDKLSRPKIVDLAVFYHDVVYNPRSKTNEEDSAERAATDLTKMGANQSTIDSVYVLIHASKDHKVNSVFADDTSFFLDSDMAILGSDPESYAKYAQGVARDFKSVEPLLYVAGRQNFLSGLVDTRIFSTAEMYARFQVRAQQNIAHELEQLAIIKDRLSSAN